MYGTGHQRSVTNSRLGWRPSAPMAAAKSGDHLSLHGTPDTLKASAHPGFAVPEHTPLPHVSRVGLEVQGPCDATALEAPVKRLTAIFTVIQWPHGHQSLMRVFAAARRPPRVHNWLRCERGACSNVTRISLTIGRQHVRPKSRDSWIHMPTNQFPPEVSKKLGTYVYRLIDPRNGETFYVGKGNGDRVFAHAKGEIQTTDPSEKMKRIREILLGGFDVSHVIHRHGMNDDTAFEVEAALMDAYAGLTNVAGGIGSADFGIMHADEILRRYAAPEATFEHKALLIIVNRSASEASLFDATRYAWKVSLTKARQAEVVLSVIQGMIVGAFIAREWKQATAENFPDREPFPGRYAFEGEAAPAELSRKYVGKRVPDSMRKRGAANPVRYTWA